MAEPTIVQGQITALNEFGDGVFKHHGATLKVARAVPGDHVRVLDTGGKTFRSVKLVAISIPSVHRVAPACTAFAQGCGGCQWQGLDYAQQLYWKSQIVQQVLSQRLQLPCAVAACIPAKSDGGQRNKLSLQNLQGTLHFMQEFNDQAIAPSHCPALTQANQELWQSLQTLTIHADVQQIHARSTADGHVGLALFATSLSPAVRELAAQLSTLPRVCGVGALVKKNWTILQGQSELEHQLATIRWRFPLHGFFQTNYTMAAQLLDYVVGLLKPRSQHRLLDLYCGAGFFTLPLARHCDQVLGIESNAAAIGTAKANAQLNGFNNCSFVAADASQHLSTLQAKSFEAILLDPPRAGCEPAVLTQLIRLAAPRLIYISCSPTSLARDLKTLCASHYRIISIQPFDMFPQTAHVETVVELLHL